MSINSITGAYPVPTNVFGPGSEHVVLGDVHCIGTESGLLECSHNSVGDHICGLYAFYYGKSEHHFDVAISCYGKYWCLLPLISCYGKYTGVFYL